VYRVKSTWRGGEPQEKKVPENRVDAPQTPGSRSSQNTNRGEEGVRMVIVTRFARKLRKKEADIASLNSCNDTLNKKTRMGRVGCTVREGKGQAELAEEVGKKIS